MSEGKISCTQLTLLLFLSRIFSILEYTPALGDSMTGMTLLISTALSFLVQCVLVIPMLLLLYRYQDQNVLGCAYLVSPVLGKITAALFLLLFLAHLSGGYAIFSMFMTNIVYLKSSSMLIIVLLAAVCTTCACFGLQGLARAGSIVFVLFTLSTVFLCLVASDGAEFLNIHMIQEDGILRIIQGTLESTSKNAEFFVLLLLLPQIAKPQKKRACVYWFLILVFIFTEVTQFIILSVLGDFGMKQMFPYYALTTVIDISILQRLDSLHVTLWIFTALFHGALYTICAIKCAGILFPKKISRFSPLFIPLISGCAGIFLGNHILLLQRSGLSNFLILALVTAVFPLILFVILYRKEKRHAPPKSPAAPDSHS